MSPPQGNPAAASQTGPIGPATGSPRPFLRLWFACARQYTRAGRLPDGSGYLGRCPTCGKTIRFGIGPGGTSQRFFEVSCR